MYFPAQRCCLPPAVLLRRYLAVRAELPEVLRPDVTGTAARDAVSMLQPASLARSYGLSPVRSAGLPSGLAPASPGSSLTGPAAAVELPGQEQPSDQEARPLSPAAPLRSSQPAGRGAETPHEMIEAQIMSLIRSVCSPHGQSTPTL